MNQAHQDLGHRARRTRLAVTPQASDVDRVRCGQLDVARPAGPDVEPNCAATPGGPVTFVSGPLERLLEPVAQRNA